MDGSATQTIRLADDGRIPNNPALPLVLHRRAVAPGGDLAAAFEEAFARNGWRGGWRDGIFAYHHYHATAHEVLGIAAGRARVRFGGEQGETVEVEAGDVVVIPAGVGHKNLGASPDFLVVGAYPAGQDPDMNTGRPEEHARALALVPRVPLPAADPVFGSGGPLVQLWGRSC
ncbi:cupin domain-containing protein [Azospirillum sp. A39]|uniref:cupin domain-containing protein n=1 Tax=Azospirillum sp. A39 TaxID=3462279 RepID=UPI0040456838